MEFIESNGDLEEADVCAAQASEDDSDLEADVCAAQASEDDDQEKLMAGVQSQPQDVLQSETTTMGWLEERVDDFRCKCPRCIYARPRVRELPDAFECHIMNGRKRCRLRFPTNELLVVHQLDVHETVFPICPKQRLNMQNHVEYSKPRPPPTVYVFLQRDNPLIKPDEDLDVSAEIARVRVVHDLELATVVKKVHRRGLHGFVKMSFYHEEPETAMFDVFMEAAERWMKGDKYERLAQFQEAMVYYKATKELPARTTPSQYPLIGYGRNWLKS
ncbi:hypothetical protein H310_06532 [Aphanomyces invadans]|uniref:C2H2-type domain-containing protein n=1 Tax=Aphanomyces invadans TaxID=157072 RepID=A0A024U728_9STRA|nr:hypothetical protein H310_06532 [Aphanomyces invadans]ETW02015.1 hypothetical protein H310_06532 [Aphanomyces invadans]RHY30765.1 hypothetical protein DYB32_004044 [Aphanomyces invadans]|eukprot:XP_008869863.1 hypothetical protein H310_06532 [Aphanomyces invadans]